MDGIRGDVIDQSLMGITLLEIGPGDKTHQYTGLTIYLPNSLFLSTTVKNETFLWSDFVFHLMTIPIKGDAQWQNAENDLLQAARDVSAPYLDQTRQTMKTQALQQNLEQVSIEPRVQAQISDPERYNLILRVLVPARKRAKLEQDIARHYLKLMENPDKGLPVSNT